jgi:hypothetical protein
MHGDPPCGRRGSNNGSRLARAPEVGKECGGRHETTPIPVTPGLTCLISEDESVYDIVRAPAQPEQPATPVARTTTTRDPETALVRRLVTFDGKRSVRDAARPDWHGRAASHDDAVSRVTL